MVNGFFGGVFMLEYLRKRQGEAKAQETEKEQAAVPAGAGNQAMLSMLEAQEERGENRPASGGTPLAEAMRAKFERHFGLPMDDVRVHRNSDEPAKFDAGAYTYGTDIFIGPGQEDLLNHEMTHVAQQKLGQVRPTGMEHGMAVNRSPALEHSADAGSVAQTAGTAAGPVVQCGDDDEDQSVLEPPAKKRRRVNPSGATAARQDVAKAAGMTPPCPVRQKKGRQKTSKYKTQKKTDSGGKKHKQRVQKSRALSAVLNRRRMAAAIGTHGYKHSEQKRLSKIFKVRITGSTFESEHAVGFAAANTTNKRRQELRDYENALPAYQEAKPMHRQHIGTGSNTWENVEIGKNGEWLRGFRFGFGRRAKPCIESGDEFYRRSQRQALDEHRVGNAIQLNQLGYSVMYQHAPWRNQRDVAKADSSFAQMVINLTKFPYPYVPPENGKQTMITVTPEEQAEMILSRLTMAGASYPSYEVENAVRRFFKLKEIKPRYEDRSKLPQSYDDDQKQMLARFKNMTKNLSP